jgi:hypothetical protein
LLRLPAAIIGSALGRVPLGNTGGANVSALAQVPLSPDHQRLLESDRRSNRHRKREARRAPN